MRACLPPATRVRTGAHAEARESASSPRQRARAFCSPPSHTPSHSHVRSRILACPRRDVLWQLDPSNAVALFSDAEKDEAVHLTDEDAATAAQGADEYTNVEGAEFGDASMDAS